MKSISTLIFLSYLFLSCGGPKSDFKKASNKNTVEAYQEFLQKYPESEFTEKVRTALCVVEFSKASTKNTVEAYQEFIQMYPTGTESDIAKKIIDSLTTISGGCKAEMDELTNTQKNKINSIVSLIGKRQDERMLAELYNLLKEDSLIKFKARPKIQQVLKSVIEKHKIESRGGGQKDFAGLIDYYTSISMYSEFSYEAIICREISLISFQTMLDGVSQIAKKSIDKTDNFSTAMEVLQETALAANKIKSLRETELLNGILDINDRSLDVCAKKQFWEYVGRLIKGGIYFPYNGIESREELVNILKKAYREEKHEIILELSGNIIRKIDADFLSRSDSLKGN